MTAAVVTKDLQKIYGKQTRALKGVSLSVDRGLVYALLGANGAGKTTFIRIVATQLMPTAGSVSALGFDVVNQPGEVRQRIAVVPQEGRPFLVMTPYEHVFMYLVSRGMTFGEARTRADHTLNSLNMQAYRNVICTNLSGGLRQKVLIAMAMATEAELLVLDEPTIGLDPIARVEVWNLIRDYVSNGRTILLSTHYMDEAESLSDKLAIINRGEVVALGTPSEIKSKLPATHVVTVKSANQSEEFQRFGSVLKAGTTLRILTTQQTVSEASAFCLKKGLEFSVRPVTIEDVFIKEVGAIEAESN